MAAKTEGLPGKLMCETLNLGPPRGHLLFELVDSLPSGNEVPQSCLIEELQTGMIEVPQCS